MVNWVMIKMSRISGCGAGEENGQVVGVGPGSWNMESTPPLLPVEAPQVLGTTRRRFFTLPGGRSAFLGFAKFSNNLI